MASPHPTEGKCIHPQCGGVLTDIWSEFLETTAEKAALGLGTANFTCPYCSRPLRFDPVTNRVVPAQPGAPLQYNYRAAVKRAANESTSIFGLMRDKGMLKGETPAFLGYLFKDRETPLTDGEGELLHTESEGET